MDQTPTVLGGIHWIFNLVGDVAFQWVPGMVISVTSPNTPQGFNFPPPPIAGPASTQDMSDFLQATAASGVYDPLVHNWGLFVALSTFLCLLFASLVIYCVIRIIEIRRFEYARWAAMAHPVASHNIPQAQLRWNRIKEEASGESDQARRLAILEADIMLNELLDTLGYRGETMADKMRAVERSDFKTIDFAWEAHRVRNAIAHEGAALQLSPHEARRVIGLYEQVFREFEFV